MPAVIHPITPSHLPDYATIPMLCEVHSILAVEEINRGLAGLQLREQPLPVPYTKDYDAYPNAAPPNWPQRFDLANWGLWIARDGDDAVGGAAVAWNTPGVHMLEDQSDMAVLWDIRVRPSSRRHGIGTALFQQVVQWATSKGCRLLKIETQNVNVPACRFYAKMGCFLGQIDRLAYRQCPGLAEEIMLVWYLNLAS